MGLDLTNPIFHDEDKAREHLEAQRWPNGPFCPHCGEAANVHRLQGKSHRQGLFQCNSCLLTFTVMVGSIFERSHIPLQKWVLAFHLMAASKKGMSAKQLERMLGITYKSAWFMCHRIREAMAPAKKPGPIGGTNKVVESDETFIGGKAKNRAYKPEPKKQVVLALVDREGHSFSFHIANVKAQTLRQTIVRVADRKSHLMTDENLSYFGVGNEFAGHSTVNHSANELWILPPDSLKNEREFYRKLAEIITKHRAELGDVDIADVQMVTDKHPVIAGMRKAGAYRLTGGGAIFAKRSVYNGYYLGEAIILQMEL